MSNEPLNTALVDKAIVFAVQAHQQTARRGKQYPYIIHPLEAMTIVATMTDDPEILAAAVLHDTVEDTDVTLEDLRQTFGDRVAALVESESDLFLVEGQESKTWHERKEQATERLRNAPRDAQMVALGDKLSNMRAIARDYAAQGEKFWSLFHVKDKASHAARYNGLVAALSPLAGLDAYEEFKSLVDKVFNEPQKKETIAPVLVDLAEYEPVGEGANGISYNHKSDPSILLKLYSRGTIRQPLDEWMLSRRVYDMGIPTPEPGDFVTDGTHYGLRFKRVLGKRSFARAIGEEPEKVGEYARAFAEMSRMLHSTPVDTTVFESVKTRYLNLLEENPFFTDTEKYRLADFINAVPDRDTALHGDLQFGNVIFANGKEYFIDLGDFCYGHPDFDLGMVYLSCRMNDAKWTREVFHMEPETAVAFWEAFVPAYFGPDRTLEDVEQEIRPFAGLKTLIVERDTKRPMPEFRAGLKDIL